VTTPRASSYEFLFPGGRSGLDSAPSGERLVATQLGVTIMSMKAMRRTGEMAVFTFGVLVLIAFLWAILP
jgi:hypothetical protein